jgi:hypothetical protein
MTFLNEMEIEKNKYRQGYEKQISGDGNNGYLPV